MYIRFSNLRGVLSHAFVYTRLRAYLDLHACKMALDRNGIWESQPGVIGCGGITVETMYST